MGLVGATLIFKVIDIYISIGNGTTFQKRAWTFNQAFFNAEIMISSFEYDFEIEYSAFQQVDSDYKFNLSLSSIYDLIRSVPPENLLFSARKRCIYSTVSTSQTQ